MFIQSADICISQNPCHAWLYVVIAAHLQNHRRVVDTIATYLLGFIGVDLSIQYDPILAA